MPFNGAGVYQRVRNWVADATAGIKIRADYHDAEDDGFAAGLSNCIARDGQSIITQNIPFNSKRITALADPVNAQDVATKAYADTKLDAVRDKDKLVPPGAIMDFATLTAPVGWLVCDGASILVTSQQALFDAIGYTWGGSGTSFNLPALQDRFRRGKGTIAGAVGTIQADQNKTHTHAVTGSTAGDSPDHSHNVAGSTVGCGSTLDHLHSGGATFSTFTSGGFVNVGSANGLTYGGPAGTGGADRNLDHTHALNIQSGGASARHTHAINFTSADGTNTGTEVRPLSATVLTCIKT